jgi:hypothetical protein
MKADKRFQELSLENIEILKKFTEKHLDNIFIEFIEKCDGISNQKQIKLNHEKNKLPKTLEKKISTYEKTKNLVADWKTLDEIVEIRKMTKVTIIKHIIKLMEDYPDMDFSQIRPKEELIVVVKKAEEICRKKSIDEDFDQNGKLKLGLLHRELNGKYDYNDIRLARIFF